MAQECPRSILGLSTRLPSRSSIILRLGDSLRRTPKVRGSSLLQVPCYLVPTFAHVSWISNTDIAVFVISGVCIVLVVTEIILYTATMLHPLAYLILQLGKTITWLVIFTLADRDYIWNTSALEYGLTAELIENLVLL